MAATDYANFKRTAGAAANAFETILEVQPYGTGTPTEGAWKPVPDLNNFDPAFTPQTKDTTVYGDKGSTSVTKTGDDWAASFNHLVLRTATGEFAEPTVTFLRASEGTGSANLLHIRYYDALGASYAYQGVASVSVKRQNTGATDTNWFTVNLTGNAKFSPITNPIVPTGGGH